MAQTYINNALRPFYDMEKWEGINNIIAQGAVGANLFTGVAPDNKVGQIITRSFDKDISRDMSFTLVTSNTTSASGVDMSSYTASLPMIVETTVIDHSQFEAFYKGEGDNEQAILKQIANVRKGVLDRQQSRLKTMLELNLAAGASLANHYDNSYAGGAFSGSSLRKAIVDMVGEKFGRYNEMIVHSYTYQQMVDDNLVNYAPASNLGINLFENPSVPVFDGKRVIVNDTICAPTAGVYPVYVMRRGAISLEYSGDVRITDVTSTAGGGTLSKQFTFSYSPYILGLTYGTTTISEAAIFETAGNWTTAWDEDEIDIVKVDFGG